MDWLQDWWAAVLGIGAAVIGTLKYLFSHGKKHEEIDRRLDSGASNFEKNDDDHEKMIEKVESVEEHIGKIKVSMASVETHVEWLVNSEKRRNGNG